MSIYIVKQGDSIDSIAVMFGVSAAALSYANQIPYPYRLAVGQALLINDGSERQGERAAVVNGYAYPFIREWTLRQTLPYLTQVSVFSYGFTTEGDLVPPMWEDEWMITLAAEYRAEAILTLTPFGADGRFNNYLVSVISNDMAAQQNLIEQLLYTVAAKGYAGVDIDFEYILAADREAFADFVYNVRVALNEQGYSVSVALAPKIADDQPGLLYEGKDYALLGEAANSVLLMTYEWGYTYGPPMAVAPIGQVRRVVEYAVTRIPEEKISLGIPNYGYDWLLPYERGVTRARTIGNVEAVQLAIEENAEIFWDERAMSPYFHYRREGAEHEVWFEDVRSMSAKFDLVEEFGLRGMGYWQIMQLFRANWLLLADRFFIRKTE